MPPKPIIDLEAIALRRAEEQMSDLANLKAAMAEPMRHPHARLTRFDAEEIRLRLEPWTDSKGVLHPGEGVRALGRFYGVDAKTIRKVRDGITWRSTGAEPIVPLRLVEDDE